MASQLRRRAASRKVRTGLKNRGNRRKPSLNYYTIYIGDGNRDGADYPVFGTISELGLVRLGTDLKKLQSLPNGGKYKTASGLSVDYNFEDKILFKQVKGKAGDIDYNNVTPIPVTKFPTKISLYVKGTERAGVAGKNTSKLIAIGVPSDLSYQEAALFIQREGFDKNPKALKWKFGKVVEVLRELGNAARGRKPSAEGFWLIPFGLRSKVKSTKNGSPSKASASASEKVLVVATIKERAAIMLGFANPKANTVDEIIKGTTIDKTVSSNATGGFNAVFQGFKKLRAQTSIFDEKESKQVEPLKPGVGITVKVRFTYSKIDSGTNKDVVAIVPYSTPTGGERNIGKNRKVVQTSKTCTFKVPSGTPIGLVFSMMMNTPNRATSFQASGDGKNFGNSYPLPSRKATVKPKA
jgi:hypothetical protein